MHDICTAFCALLKWAFSLSNFVTFIYLALSLPLPILLATTSYVSLSNSFNSFFMVFTLWDTHMERLINLRSTQSVACDIKPVWPEKNRQMSIKVAYDRFWHFYKNCLRMWDIWANYLLPKALKSCPKCKKSPNLVTLKDTHHSLHQNRMVNSGTITKSMLKTDTPDTI